MRRLVIIPILTIVCAFKSYSQVDTTKGIQFVHNLSWQEVLQKAKAENKYIFVDCYASWCGPCKWMDKHIYSNDTVGRDINDEFLAVKMQMDSTQHDNEQIKSWYATAHLIGEQYRINDYPSLLFFSPDGQIVHEDIGARDMKDFLALLKTAIDPHQQYFTLLTHYQQGEKSYDMMPYLVKTARNLGQKNIEMEVAQTYFHDYLETLPTNQLWTPENLAFIGSYWKIISPGNKLFQLYYCDRKRIDSIMDIPGYSDQLVNSVIYKEEITPALDVAIKQKSEPNWHRVRKNIEKKYNKGYAEKNVTKGRMDFYNTTKQWEKYATYLIRFEQETTMQTIQRGSVNTGMAIFLNNCAWEIFQYSKKKKELDTAISWEDLAISMSSKIYPTFFDTKANLLYKLRENDEAIKLEEQSYSLATNDKAIEENLKKMKNGLPTWTLDDEKKGHKE